MGYVWVNTINLYYYQMSSKDLYKNVYKIQKSKVSDTIINAALFLRVL